MIHVFVFSPLINVFFKRSISCALFGQLYSQAGASRPAEPEPDSRGRCTTSCFSIGFRVGFIIIISYFHSSVCFLVFSRESCGSPTTPVWTRKNNLAATPNGRASFCFMYDHDVCLVRIVEWDPSASCWNYTGRFEFEQGETGTWG